MKKNESFTVSVLKAIVRFTLKIFYGNTRLRKKAMHEINFLAPKSDYLNEYKKHRRSA